MLATLALVFTGVIDAQAQASAKPRTFSEVIAASKPSDWREIDPQNTLYLQLESGRVIIELAPAFAPRHVENIKTLVPERFFDGLAITRSQDNYVVQWGDTGHTKDIGRASRTLAPEFVRSAKGLPFTPLPDPDTYAPEAGFSDGFPAARDGPEGHAWLVHCYAMVGVGRDNDADSGGGTELYAVIGHSPRHLDRNITLVGRVVHGIERLSVLPRGTGPLGFYETAEERVPILSVRVAADLPEAERTPLEALRTDTQTFADLVESRRNRREEWFKVPAGRIEVCNVPLVVRERKAAP